MSRNPPHPAGLVKALAPCEQSPGLYSGLRLAALNAGVILCSPSPSLPQVPTEHNFSVTRYVAVLPAYRGQSDQCVWSLRCWESCSDLICLAASLTPGSLLTLPHLTGPCLSVPGHCLMSQSGLDSSGCGSRLSGPKFALISLNIGSRTADLPTWGPEQ